MSNNAPIYWLKSVSAAILMLAANSVFAGYTDVLNMTEGVTPISHDVYDLHMIILWVVTIIGVVVFGVMAWSIFYHRKSRGAVAADFHESTQVELLWTMIPFVILIAMAIPATSTLIDMEDTTRSDMTIKITGYQWKWKYDYLDEDISFYSSLAMNSRELIYDDPTGNENYLLEVDNPVVVPVGKKIRFLVTADDVIHAWWVPAIGMKKDAIPGFINEIWAIIEEPGVYRGQCAELCGKGHGFMPIVLVAKPEDEYRAWVASKKGLAYDAGESAQPANYVAAR